MKQDPRIFLAIPAREALGYWRAAQVVYTASTVHPQIESVVDTSLLCYGFNTLWCQALNMRAQMEPGKVITHFAMLHADIEPEPGFLDTMIEEMDRVGADVLSAVVPLKDGSGVTSTAIGGVHGRDGWHPRRLTLRECSELPETFEASDIPWNQPTAPLLINTGLMLCRFTEPWVEQACFKIEDHIRLNHDGKFEAVFVPEDWNFSRWCHRCGLKVFATTKVRLTHVGKQRFPNYGNYGQLTDEANTAAVPSFPAGSDEPARREENAGPLPSDEETTVLSL